MDDSSSVMLRPMAGRRWDDDERGEESPTPARSRARRTSSSTQCDAPTGSPRNPRCISSRTCSGRASRSRSSWSARRFPRTVYDVELRWAGETDRIGEVRATVFALVGGFAEVFTYVRQRRGADAVVFEVVTGILGEESSFSPHGHAVRLSVAGVR